MAKMPSEIDAIRRAVKVADEGYEVFRQAARPGRADYELIAEIEAFFRANGVDHNFQIIGVGGPEVRGMAPPSGRKLKRGDMVTTELTPCVDGYYAQICRTLVVGEANAEQRKAFALYLEAMEAGIAVVRDGVTAADIARAENDVFRRCTGSVNTPPANTPASAVTAWACSPTASRISWRTSPRGSRPG